MNSFDEDLHDEKISALYQKIAMAQVSADLDRKIIALAHQELAKPSRSNKSKLRFVPWLATAASLILVVGLALQIQQESPSSVEELPLETFSAPSAIPSPKAQQNGPNEHKQRRELQLQPRKKTKAMPKTAPSVPSAEKAALLKRKPALEMDSSADVSPSLPATVPKHALSDSAVRSESADLDEAVAIGHQLNNKKETLDECQAVWKQGSIKPNSSAEALRKALEKAAEPQRTCLEKRLNSLHPPKE